MGDILENGRVEFHARTFCEVALLMSTRNTFAVVGGCLISRDVLNAAMDPNLTDECAGVMHNQLLPKPLRLQLCIAVLSLQRKFASSSITGAHQHYLS